MWIMIRHLECIFKCMCLKNEKNYKINNICFKMELIVKQTAIFKKMTLDYIINKYSLNCVKLCSKTALYPCNIYEYKNMYIVNNFVLNEQYKLDLDTARYSILHVCYKNLSYRNTSYKAKNVNKNVGDWNKCVLESDYRRYISKDINYITKKYTTYINKYIWIIGRKYKNEKTLELENNSLLLPIFIDRVSSIRKCNHKLNAKMRSNKDKDDVVSVVSHQYRRRFLYTLKNCLGNVNYSYINQILSNSICLDIEYANDIYDDFSKFPISNNSSCLFMIGVFDYKNTYKNFIASQLDKRNEGIVLKTYLDYIHQKISNDGKIIIFHWSNADKIVIEKTLLRHPKLHQFYNTHIVNNIVYIDLLKVVKSTVFLNSYSLKYVLEKLLNIKYNTHCKNGLDAMSSIIYNNIEIKNNNNKKKLTDFQTTNDIIQYNKLDTIYLYDIIKKFVN